MPRRLIDQFLSDEPACDLAEVSAQVLVAESNHRIANNLTMVAGLGRLQAAELARSGRSLQPDEAAALLLEFSGRIETVGRLHRLLSETPSGSTPELGTYLCDIALSAVASMSKQGSAPRFSAEIRNAPYQTSGALSLGFIVGELVTNSIKYAHPSGVQGEIRLRCEQTRDGSTIVEVSDDGVGFPEGFDPENDGGLGLRLVRSLAGNLHGELAYEQTDLGLSVRVSIPAARR